MEKRLFLKLLGLLLNLHGRLPLLGLNLKLHGHLLERLLLIDHHFGRQKPNFAMPVCIRKGSGLRFQVAR